MRLTRNPLAAIEVQRTRSTLRGHGAPPDLIGKAPGWFLKEYVLTTLWIRSTSATVALLEKVERRSWGGWDQLVFSEELNWGVGENVSCCHTDCLAKQLRSDASVPKAAGVHPPRCAGAGDAFPSADLPPLGSRNRWPRINSSKGWRTGGYNSLAIPFHRFGPCTSKEAACQPDRPCPGVSSASARTPASSAAGGGRRRGKGRNPKAAKSKRSQDDVRS